MDDRVRKRLFITLLACSLLFLVFVFSFAWWLVAKQYLFVNQIILTLALMFFILLFLIAGAGIFFLVFSLWRAQNYRILNTYIHKTIDFLFPLALTIGQWLGFEKDRIKNSYIQVSNQLVKIARPQISPENILILAPHCLQRVQCPHKITVDVNNCRGCGLCPVGDLLTLSREKGTQLVIATGGTFARKFVKERKPQAIVAIACERDLTSGMQDVDKIPVIGVVNERPEVPCHNTRVNLCEVERAINYFIQGGEV
ncbi:MAG: DUF116 domain-containing protein [Clostridia bacterium]|nr:DUF116 domain-containing protein [Clostridia bacterium]